MPDTDTRRVSRLLRDELDVLTLAVNAVAACTSPDALAPLPIDLRHDALDQVVQVHWRAIPSTASGGWSSVTTQVVGETRWWSHDAEGRTW